MTKALIHVNRKFLAQNAKDGGSRPVYTTKIDGEIVYAHSVVIRSGTVTFIDPRSTPPLKCGARAWVEVEDGEIEFVDATTFQEVEENHRAA